MNDNERKDVHELTDEELRRELAEALGYFVMWWFNHLAWQATKDGEIIAHGKNAKTYDECWDRFFEIAALPNWPEDDGAAFRLVREVRDRLTDKASGSYWSLEFPGTKSQLLRRYVTDDRIAQGLETDGETARALSELAALALRQMGDPALTGKRD